MVAFCDNNPELHGTMLFDVPVLAPAQLSAASFDEICVASMYHPDIRLQLLRELRIPPRRISLSPEFSRASRSAAALRKRLQPAFAGLRTVGVPTSRDGWSLWRMKGSLTGRRAFVIGNGPSLRLEDLELLRSQREICLASNQIYAAFDRTAWRPSYYAIEDPDSARRGHRDIARLVECPMLIRDRYRRLFHNHPQITYFTLHPPVPYPQRPKFSRNLLLGIHSGTTITYALLQWAAWMGVESVYLLGVDCSYFVDHSFDHQVYTREKGYRYDPSTQQNYFIPDYHRSGDVLIKPDIEAQRLAYVSAYENCHRRGLMKIFNATRGGRLDVFDRVEFESLF